VTDALFLAFLAQHDDEAWHRVVDRLEHAMHPVDRRATRIWFHLFPMRLQRAVDGSGDPFALEDYLRLEGRWRLAEQRDTSHDFLFGHRYWPEVARAVLRYTTQPVVPGSLDLAAQVQEIARAAAAEHRIDPSWLVGITAVAVRTLQQAGFGDLSAGVGPERSRERAGADPDRMVASRGKAAGRGLFGFLRGPRRTWTVSFDEFDPEATFPLISDQHITTAAALDTRDYRARDPRCTEGPIPVQCRSCSCGTCWIGVLAGAEELSPVDAQERATLAALGYSHSDDPNPVIRLACMAEAHGSVSIVIPPWNGQVGVRLQRVERGT
jgi:ferredoxin